MEISAEGAKKEMQSKALDIILNDLNETADGRNSDQLHSRCFFCYQIERHFCTLLFILLIMCLSSIMQIALAVLAVARSEKTDTSLLNFTKNASISLI